MFPTPDFINELTGGLRRDLLAFLPELVLCATIVLMLLARMLPGLARANLAGFALITGAGALFLAVGQWPAAGMPGGPVPLSGGTPVFSGLLVFDTFGLFLRAFLLVFLCLSLWLSLATGIPDREDSADYATMLVGGTLGMMLMASANHLLTAFIAVEMASVPSYALAGFLKGRRKGSEAALKYVVYGASAAGVMLYGISLITGTYGTGSLPHIATAITDAPTTLPMPVAVGIACVVVGLGFKLAAFPFHFWCPDVFEGAAAEVAGFLAVASKGAALVLSARFLYAIATPTGAGELTSMAVAMGWGTLAVITATFGNLSALPQTNLKRLLAYSTIAHAGIMMLALAPVGPRSVGPLVYYLSAYLLMNLGAFAVVALVRNQTGSEDLDAFRGLARRSPLLTVVMSVFLLSLLGLPPLAGFAAKFQVFAGLYEAGRMYGSAGGGLSWFFFGLLALAALNTAISAGYYLKVVRAMTLDEPADPTPFRVPLAGQLLVGLLAVLVLAAGIFWGPLNRLADRGARSFDRPAVSVTEARP